MASLEAEEAAPWTVTPASFVLSIPQLDLETRFALKIVIFRNVFTFYINTWGEKSETKTMKRLLEQKSINLLSVSYLAHTIVIALRRKVIHTVVYKSDSSAQFQ